MHKKFLKVFLFLISLFFIVLIYLSTIGVKTNKFNELIKEKLIKIDNRLKVKIEDVFLKLDLPKREIKIETNNTDLYINDDLLKLSKINIDIGIFSYFKNQNEIKNLEIITKKNSLNKTINFLQSYRANFSLILLKNIVKKGSIEAEFKISFDKKNENYKKYLLTGEIKDAKLNLPNSKKINNINFNFNINDEEYNFENISLEYEKVKINSETLKLIKKNEIYLVKSSFKSEKSSIRPKLLFSLINFDMDLFSNENITFQTDNKFSFELNKKLKINKLQFFSKLQFDKLFVNKKYQNLVYFEDGTVETNFSKNVLYVDVLSKYSFLKNEDSSKINVNNKDDIKFRLSKKIGEDYFIQGNFKNKKNFINPNILLDIFKIKIDILPDKEIEIETDNNFSFKINNKQKINALKLKSNLKFDELVINYDSTFIKRYLKDYKNLVNLRNGSLDINYTTDKISITGATSYALDKKFDNLKFKLLKNNDRYKFKTIIQLNNSSLSLKSIDYKKDKNQFSEIKVEGDYLEDKSINLNHVSYIENKNYFKIDKLKLNQKFKVLDIKKIKVNYINTKRELNNFVINKNKQNYVLLGKSIDSTDLINDLLKDKTNKRFLDNFVNLNTNLDIKIDKVILDKNHYLENFYGDIEFNKNKIASANLVSEFTNKDKFSFSIKKGNDGQKITALYSDNAEPFVKKFKFIKGFEGGNIDFFSIKNGNLSSSKININKFKVKEVPALATLLSLASLQGIADLMTGEGIRFEDFEMKFSNKNDLMTIDEIYAIGPAISILSSGYIEKNNLVSLRGTLVPATTLNKAIGSIPFLGKILVGKKTGEGVFGVSFKIKGPPKNLKTTVNPIKTLTPRFITRTLEKIKKN